MITYPCLELEKDFRQNIFAKYYVTNYLFVLHIYPKHMTKSSVFHIYPYYMAIYIVICALILILAFRLTVASCCQRADGITNFPAVLYAEILMPSRAYSRFAPSQWEMALLCNDISHWLGAILESALPSILHVANRVPMSHSNNELK